MLGGFRQERDVEQKNYRFPTIISLGAPFTNTD